MTLSVSFALEIALLIRTKLALGVDEGIIQLSF